MFHFLFFGGGIPQATVKLKQFTWHEALVKGERDFSRYKGQFFM